MRVLIALIPILIAITLSNSAPQQNTLYGDYERSSELKHKAEKNTNPGMWTKFKNGTRNFFHRCIKFNSTVVHVPENDNKNYETEFSLSQLNSTDIPETKESCWQYLKKIGSKGKGWISRKIWGKNENHDTESTTRKQGWFSKGTKTRVAMNQTTTTERPSSDEYKDINVANFERSL